MRSDDFLACFRTVQLSCANKASTENIATRDTLRLTLKENGKIIASMSQ